jgi:parallel beta-helix repeat protein
MYLTPSEGSSSLCITVLLVPLAFLLFYDVVFGKNYVGRLFSAILRLLGLRKSVELPSLPKTERPTRRQPPPPPRPGFRERMANLLSPARLWSSFLLILRLLKPVVFLAPLVMILTAVVCWLAGWRTIDEYATGLVYAGYAVITIGLFGLLGGWGATRTFSYTYAQSAGHREPRTHQRESAASTIESYSFTMRLGVTGILIVLIGSIILTSLASLRNPATVRAFLQGGACPGVEEGTQPVTITLAADGSGDCVSLEAAVEAAPAGSTIRLGPGTYRLEERLEVDKALRIAGAGMDQTEIVSEEWLYVVQFSGDDISHVEDISFRHEGDKVADVVRVTGGEVNFSRCRFTGAVRTGEGSVAPGAGSAGLRFGDQAQGVVRDCEAVGNGSVGILVEDAQPTLEGNSCVGNALAGIVYLRSAGGTAQRNNCSDNGYGILVVEQADPELRENICAGNGYGILVGGQAHPELRENTCVDNEGFGIIYTGEAWGTATGNQCLRNGGTGIFVREEAQLELEENVCANNVRTGITFSHNSGGYAHRNACYENGIGIHITETADPVLEDNHCYDNTEANIMDERE